jgi:hypothetical protein
MQKLNFKQTLVDAFNLGIANILNLLLTALLWIITVWIPYLNVGTTIGFFKIIVALSKGEEIKPTSIFSKENYKGLGDFFLLFGLQTAGIIAAAMLFVAPIVSLAWQFAFYFFVDKKVSPLKALALSYDTTCGEKWTLFFLYLVFGLIISVVCSLLALVPYIGGILAFAAVIACIAIVMGLEAVLYKHFSAKAEAPAAE